MVGIKKAAHNDMFKSRIAAKYPMLTLIRYNGCVINPDDTELVARVADGDERAFLALYDRYASRVHALTLRILGESMLAEEATQDTFLKLWSRARQYLAERGSLLIWLLTIARRTALDRLRLEGRRPTLSNSEDPDTAWQSIASEDSLTSEARWRSMYFAVQSLPEEQRQVIELAYYQGLSQSEIAELLGWPLGTVKSRIRSAMEFLRQEWSQDDSL